MKINKYTQEHIDYLRLIVPGRTVASSVILFNEKFDIKITEAKLSNLKHKHGIKNGLIGGRFEKGHATHNKGKKWNDFMSEEGQKGSLNTCFKKGHTLNVKKALGSERINVYGYTEVKVAQPNTWVLKHRVVYEEKFGLIPKGYKVTFADQDKTNFSLNNLILISAYENLIMNNKGLYSSNSDLTKTGVLVARVLNEINKKNKK